jgi:hypothetical protein
MNGVMDRIIITGTNNRIGLVMTQPLLEMGGYVRLFSSHHFPIAMLERDFPTAKQAEKDQGEKI